MTDTQNETSTESATPKKARNVEIFYIDSKGARAARPQPDVAGFGKKFLDTQQEMTAKLDDFSNEVLRQAAAFGFQQVTQNAYGAAADGEERQDLAEARLETLLNGSWASDRQSGPRSSDLLDAWAGAHADKHGSAPDDGWLESAKQKLESGEVTAKDLQANPRIRAKLDQIKAERAAERARKSAEAAGGSTQASDSLLD